MSQIKEEVMLYMGVKETARQRKMLYSTNKSKALKFYMT